MSAWTSRLRRSTRELLQELFPSVQQEAIAQAQADGWQLEDGRSSCPRCGATVGLGAATARGCQACLDQRLPWLQVVRLGHYRPPLSQWVLDMKFHHQWAWAGVLGRWLGERIQTPADGGPVVVCPVPMHWRRRCRRGYNQSALIARGLAGVHGWPVASPLRRRRLTVPQTLVHPDRRYANLHGSFAARNLDLTGWHVWLVDDVKTTGATLRHCARLLRRQGAASVRVAVVAVAQPHGPGFQQQTPDS